MAPPLKVYYQIEYFNEALGDWRAAISRREDLENTQKIMLSLVESHLETLRSKSYRIIKITKDKLLNEVVTPVFEVNLNKPSIKFYGESK